MCTYVTHACPYVSPPLPLARRSQESLQENAQRLKAYKSNLVIFPRNAKKPKAFETAGAGSTSAVAQHKGTVMPISKAKPAVQMVKITSDMKSAKVYNKLRLERVNARLVGVREKRVKEAAAKAKEAQSLR